MAAIKSYIKEIEKIYQNNSVKLSFKIERENTKDTKDRRA